MGAFRSRLAPLRHKSDGMEIELMIGANLFNFRHNDKTAFRVQIVAGARPGLTKVNSLVTRRESCV